jgi:hypothetical protein
MFASCCVCEIRCVDGYKHPHHLVRYAISRTSQSAVIFFVYRGFCGGKACGVRSALSKVSTELIFFHLMTNYSCRNLRQWTKLKGIVLIHVWLNDCLGWRTEPLQHRFQERLVAYPVGTGVKLALTSISGDGTNGFLLRVSCASWCSAWGNVDVPFRLSNGKITVCNV